MTDQDVFTTATAGLKEVLNPRVLRLWDGDRLDLDISPVRKSLRGADLRMLAYTMPSRLLSAVAQERPPNCRAGEGDQVDVGVKAEGIARVVRVASSGGLITTELPVASAGPIFQASMAIGKFQGSNATTHESLIDDEADSAAASAAIHDVVTPVRTSQPLASR